MRFGKEFAVGAVVGMVAGIAGVVYLGICGMKRLCEDVRFEREVKSALIKTILGKDCTSYSFKRSNHDSYMDYAEGVDHKVWPKEKAKNACQKYASYKIDDKSGYAVMDICGVEGLYSDKRGELEKELLNECTSYDSGIYDCDGNERVTADRFWISGKDYYLYYLRGGKDNDPGAICAIEKGPVAVNYCGVFVTDKKLDILEVKSYCEIGEDDWCFTDEWMTVSDFIDGEGWRQR